MTSTTKNRKTNDPFDLDTSSREVMTNNDRQKLERAGSEALEPRVWRTLGRLLHEFIFIVFFISIHWVIKLLLSTTQQAHELWAIYLHYVSIIYAATAFTIIFGAELIADCKQAIRFVLRRIREK